jgi:phosphoribosylformylglycinamidine (FGAM) synthase-like enzyme
VKEIFAKWGLDAAEIGRVTEDGRLRVFHRGRLVADLPARLLTEEAPVYTRPMRSGDRRRGRVGQSSCRAGSSGRRSAPDAALS